MLMNYALVYATKMILDFSSRKFHLSFFRSYKVRLQMAQWSKIGWNTTMRI